VLLRDSGYTYFFSEQDLRGLFTADFEIVSIDEGEYTETSTKRFFFVILRAL